MGSDGDITISYEHTIRDNRVLLLQRKMDKREKAREEKEKVREQQEFLLVKSIGAAIALGEASAIALKNGHTNGETEAALEYARKVKHEQKDFLTRQGIESIY